MTIKESSRLLLQRRKMEMLELASKSTFFFEIFEVWGPKR